MKIISKSFEHNQSIPKQYTCDGEDTSPQLSIGDVPIDTKSLVIIMDDPDAIKPAGKVWDHWIVFNIPPDTIEIPEGKEPRGIHGIGTSENFDYHGPCPPDTEHRYFFKVYALDAMLDLIEGVTKAEVIEAMQGHIIDQAELVGLYNRN
ncbi:YbhB/YbcL family Raf kinase inhibitor-like protein [Candidatus Parcubacteria bacterium]|jgi:hypothetical protein|nr:YbhB/YbcL family Raf kinase inhibitor-like protein [Candidatus Parcubacteria bacterium]MBT7228039.1 YbhB/YbcL family Raf kinase inhibitor-like protein [Candidatus Parcubacteria bacterium]